ncbi:hypothetical protein FRB99_008536 [Tulasnella sp. 403]|nr:hypothetical protein FRB99_008536 [Tulasnella sp. 403]
MDRRRSGTKTRPPTAEELQYWSQTLSSLTKIQQLQSATDFTKVNKWMATLPHQDPTAHHDSSQQDTLEALRNVKAKLTSGLAEIKTNADAEAKAVSDALESFPSHPNAYDEYPPGTSVLGLYPDTSCFYKAVVIAGPRDPPPAGTRSAGQAKSYRLKFEDDDDQIRAVHVQWVVEAPPENSATSG